MDVKNASRDKQEAEVITLCEAAPRECEIAEVCENLGKREVPLISVECICTQQDVSEDYVKVPISARLRNWPVWIALLGSLGIILNSLGVFARLGLDNDAWNAIVNALGAIFIALGVVNNPTDPKHF